MNVAVVVFTVALFSFFTGWKVAGWQRDSVDLFVQKTAETKRKQMTDVASKNSRELETKLEELKDAPPREIRTEVVKPVFTHVCLSDEFVSMYNSAITNTERALSGKSENKVPDKSP